MCKEVPGMRGQRWQRLSGVVPYAYVEATANVLYINAKQEHYFWNIQIQVLKEN